MWRRLSPKPPQPAASVSHDGGHCDPGRGISACKLAPGLGGCHRRTTEKSPSHVWQREKGRQSPEVTNLGAGSILAGPLQKSKEEIIHDHPGNHGGDHPPAGQVQHTAAVPCAPHSAGHFEVRGGAGMTSREECISLIMSLTPEERRQLLAMWKEQRNERLSAQINTGTTES